MLARARAEFDVNAFHHNIRVLSAHAGVPVLLPVKADAYGHGATLAVRASSELPEVWGYGVATPREAVTILDAAAGKPVLLLTPPDPSEIEELAGLGVRLPVSAAAEARRLPRDARVHLKVNTGMNRLGVRPEEASEVAQDLRERGLLEGVYTHFAGADCADLTSARGQLALFSDVVAGLSGVVRHASNSGGVLSFGRDAAFDLVRPGIASYGYAPEAHLQGLLPLRPVLTLRARVGLVHRVRAGEAVSYGALWRADRDTDVAVVQCGYADGFPRPATGRAWVTVKGARRPVLGRICMDQFMVDVTGLDVRAGEWIEVLGGSSADADEVGAWAGTISYEVLTGLGTRVERVFAPERTAPDPPSRSRDVVS